MEFEAAKVMPAPAERVFEVVSDISRLPEWLPTVSGADSPSGDRIHVEGDRGDAHYDSQGLFRPRPEQLRVEWGSADTGAYAGWLQVAHQADGSTSEVTIHLSFFEQLDKAYHGSRASAVEAELDEALNRLAGEFG